MYVVEFAPDGKHWNTVKRGGVDSVWNYMNSPAVRMQIALNRFAKFRMKNLKTGKIIGTLPIKRLNKVI